MLGQEPKKSSVEQEVFLTRNSPEVLAQVKKNREKDLGYVGTNDKFLGHIFRKEFERNPNPNDELIKSRFELSIYPFLKKKSGDKIFENLWFTALKDDEMHVILVEEYRKHLPELHESYFKKTSKKIEEKEYVEAYFLEDLYNDKINVTNREQKIPPHILLQMLRLYWKNFDKKKESYEKEVPELKEIYARKLRNLFKDFKIESVNYKELLDRYSNVEFTFMEREFAEILERGGAYSRDTHSISLVTEEIDSSSVHKFDHESSHSVAGSAFVLEKNKQKENKVVFKRSGLSIDYFDKINWLNEAITEFIARYINGNKTGAYEEEIQLLKYLTTNGKNKIDMEHFLNAHFEDGNELKYKKILFDEIAKSYDPSFLDRLNNSVFWDTTPKTLEKLKNDGI